MLGHLALLQQWIIRSAIAAKSVSPKFKLLLIGRNTVFTFSEYLTPNLKMARAEDAVALSSL
ncbi:MAG: hypothetical protein ACHBN1_29510 [Heteroscytonema crispum UTEX LB 1556]